MAVSWVGPRETLVQTPDVFLTSPQFLHRAFLFRTKSISVNEFSCPCEKAIFAELTHFPPVGASFLGHHDVIRFKTEAVRFERFKVDKYSRFKSISSLTFEL